MLSFLQFLDIQALTWVRNTFFVDAEWFRSLILLFSDSEPILFGVSLIILWFYGVKKRSVEERKRALNIFWHVLGAFVIYWIINRSLPLRPRPELMSTLPPLISHLPDNSFPSGHALFWGASWWSILQVGRLPRTAWGFFILGFLTCLSRIIAGIHYPGDILVGFLLGWGLVELLVNLPHGKIYQKYLLNLPVKIASFLKL